MKYEPQHLSLGFKANKSPKKTKENRPKVISKTNHQWKKKK